MKLSEMFTSNFLKADNIDAMADEDTGTAVVTIDRVEMVEIGQGKDAQEKPVIFFRGLQQGLVLNKTNAGTISGLYGNDTDDWSGKSIGLFTAEVEYQGKQTMGIRVRLKAPKAARPQAVPAAADDDDLPF